MSEPTPIVALSSGGKDSLFMLETLRRDPDWRVEALVTTVNEANRRVAMHGTPESLLQAQAELLGLTLTVIALPEGCDNREYERRLQRGLAPLRDAGIEAIACGDLFLFDIRQWRERSFRTMGWRPVFPIWGTPTSEMIRQLLEAPWRLVITCIDTRVLPESLLGRYLDEELVESLPPNVDPCGENSEFHSFVCNGPGFQRSIPVATGEKAVIHGRYAMIDLRSIAGV